MDDAVIAVVLFSVCMPSDIPVFMRKELVTEYSHIPDGQGQPLPPRRVTGRGSLPD
jgi:hypothetical protein